MSASKYRSLVWLLAFLDVATPRTNSTREWTREVARMNTEDEHLSSSSGPSFAWLEGSELCLRRLGPEGGPEGFCRVRLESESVDLGDLVSLPAGLELCSIAEGPKSTSIIAVDTRVPCRASKWRVIHGHRVAGPFLVTRANGAVDVFYQANGDPKRPCDSEICKQIFQPSNGTMTPLRPFRLPFLDDGNFEIFNIGSSSSNGYYFLSKHGKLVSIASNGLLENDLQVHDGTLELHTWDCNYAHGYFGYCYVDMNEPEKVRCIQTDSSLRVLVNATYEFTNIVQDLAMHNSHDGGFLLLVNYCMDRCLKYKTHLTRARVGGPDYGKHVDFAKDENCDDYLRNSFGFFEDDGETCLMSRCYVVPTDYHALDRHNIYVKCLRY